jgi:hypothetical protein
MWYYIKNKCSNNNYTQYKYSYRYIVLQYRGNNNLVAILFNLHLEYKNYKSIKIVAKLVTKTKTIILPLSVRMAYWDGKIQKECFCSSRSLLLKHTNQVSIPPSISV